MRPRQRQRAQRRVRTNAAAFWGEQGERIPSNDDQIRHPQRRRCSLSVHTRTANYYVVVLCYLLLLATQTCMASSTRYLQEEVERRGPPGEEEEEEEETYQQRESKLSDVWLCLACSLGWTVWMVAAHVRPRVEQYATEATVVYGNVLHSSVVIGDGIPIYRSVIDYMLADVEETQVRKEFQTQDHLEEGFANVEILVLPSDPTSGVLKRDWEQEYEEFLESQERRKQGRRLSLVLGAVLVTVSLAGAIMAVMRLPLETSTWGWVSIVAGVAFLWPAAILLYVNGNAITSLATQSRQAKGMVIRGEQPPPLRFSLNPCVSIDTSDGNPSVATTKQGNKEPKTVKPPAIELSRIGTKDVVMPPHLRVKISDESVVEEPRVGCYFINLPCHGRTSSPQSRNDSVSSVSSSSITQNILYPPSLDRDASLNDKHFV